jgi:signal transduction histidine kinase
MSDEIRTIDSAPAPRADLEAVLLAWNNATVRLEQTHEALREEVSRLTHELEVKNRELARKSRLADLGQMASHVAHEVRNSLVPVTLYLSLLRRRIGHDHDALQILDKITTGFTALDATVNDLLQFTSDHDPKLRTFLLRKLVDEVFSSLAPQLLAQHVLTAIDVPHRHLVTADEHMVRRAILNLVLNAIDAMPGGGTITVTSFATAQGTDLEVADTGTGLSEDTLHRAFEPFFTTKSGGTGLGLAIVYRIAEVHGGHVTAANCPEGGAAFTVHLPHRLSEAAI